ncbi:MAG: hypothetical protein ACJA01_003909, partial [Saprospiraceae bacterium]
SDDPHFPEWTHHLITDFVIFKNPEVCFRMDISILILTIYFF